MVVFAERPGFVHDDRGGARGFDPRTLRLVVEVLSPGTRRQDLGQGEADEVDRLRSFLLSGVPEYWVLNPNTEPLTLPPRTALFLRASGERWEPLEGDDLVHSGEQVHGVSPIAAGRVRSDALGLTIDVEALLAELVGQP